MTVQSRWGRDTRRMYGERLRRWGEEVGWAVTTDDNDWLIIHRENKYSAAFKNVIDLINIMK